MDIPPFRKLSTVLKTSHKRFDDCSPAGTHPRPFPVDTTERLADIPQECSEPIAEKTPAYRCGPSKCPRPAPMGPRQGTRPAPARPPATSTPGCLGALGGDLEREAPPPDAGHNQG